MVEQICSDDAASPVTSAAKANGAQSVPAPQTASAPSAEARPLQFEKAAQACAGLPGVWAKLRPEDVKVAVLGGGMSNEMFLCRSPGGEGAVVRFFGDLGDLVDRDSELAIFQEMSERGLGPKQLGLIPREAGAGPVIGRVEEFLEGWATGTAEDYQSDKYVLDVAELVGCWHAAEVACCSKEVRLFDDLRRMAAEVAVAPEPTQSLARKPERWAALLGKEFDARAAAASLTTRLLAIGGGTGGEWGGEKVFCHNDTQHGNVMTHAATGRKTLIDFEYGGYNPPYYDLANLFCEIPADYSPGVSAVGFVQPLGDECGGVGGKRGFPTLAMQTAIVARYFASRAKLGKAVAAWEDPATVEDFRQKAMEFVAGNHLFWGLWGVLQARRLGDTEAPEGEFDYAAFAANRLSFFLLAHQQ